MAMAVTKLNPEQIIEAIDKLAPAERETLSILCDKKLAEEVRKTRKEVREEHKKDKLVDHGDIFGG